MRRPDPTPLGAHRREDGPMRSPDTAMILEVPSDVRFFRPVRLAVGGLAAMVGFDVDAIDDLRIGVDELCAMAAEGGDGSGLRLVIDARPGQLLRIDVATAAGAAEIEADRLHFSRQILSVVADAYDLDVVGGQLRCWLERAPGAEGGAATAP